MALKKDLTEPRVDLRAGKQKKQAKKNKKPEEGGGFENKSKEESYFDRRLSPVVSAIEEIKQGIVEKKSKKIRPELRDEESTQALNNEKTNKEKSQEEQFSQDEEKDKVLSRVSTIDNLSKEQHIEVEFAKKQKEDPIDKLEQLAQRENLGKIQNNITEETKQDIPTNIVIGDAKIPPGEYRFPEGFLWGTSTSAYQVEGGIKNDWSEWEESDERLASLKREGLDKENYICGDAVNHYNQYEEDIERASSLNNNSIRIGIEWARVQPRKDTWNVNAINHYRDVLAQARKKGMKTVVTLWHWTNPVWVVEEGGWENKKIKDYFGEYVDFIIRELGGEIDFWVTLNEPLMHVFGGYLKGYFPPGEHSPLKAERVFWNLIIAHKEAYRRIHKHFPGARVSVTSLINHVEPANKYNPIEQAIARTLHYFWNHRFLKKIKKHLDYIGLDYYFHDRIVWYPPFVKNKNERVNDKGWEIYPEGILEVLRYLNEFRKPIYIMENGLSDKDDRQRSAFIREHLYYVHQAIEEGVDVRGYFHWSLLDNFEWAYGWTMCFGLYEVDRETMERAERPSADVYRKICGDNMMVIK